VTTVPESLTENPVDAPGEKDFLTEAEMKQFLAATRGGRHGVRDYAMMLMAYRHGLRVSELIELRLDDADLKSGRLHVRRKMGGLSAQHSIEGDELRVLRAWLRVRDLRSDDGSEYLFLSERGPMTRQAVNYLVAEIGKRAGLSFHVHPHMLRHSTGHYLAGHNVDTKLVQEYMGHKNIAHTGRYTRAGSTRSARLWR
jgi:type 1 fimbriae regulatory protein FimB